VLELGAKGRTAAQACTAPLGATIVVAHGSAPLRRPLASATRAFLCHAAARAVRYSVASHAAQRLQVQELKILANQRAARIRASAPPPMLSSQVHVRASLSYTRRVSPCRSTARAAVACVATRCDTFQRVVQPTREPRVKQCAGCAAAALPRPFTRLCRSRAAHLRLRKAPPGAARCHSAHLYGLHAHAACSRA
jgi:hypothetical protein